MSKMTVVETGFFASIQDLGRLDGRSYGVPHSGAMDQNSVIEANRYLQNSDNTTVIEMILSGGKFVFSASTQIAITGATCEVIHNTQLYQSPCTINIESGDVVKIGAAINGNFIYLAIRDGFKVQSYMNSSSYYKGILDKSLLQKGNCINYLSSKPLKTILDKQLSKDLGSLKAYTGPEFQLLNRQQQEYLLSKPFTVSNLWNRMAFQLSELLDNNLNPIKSSPVLPGTIQLTPEGKLIVLMRDAQTTGGYPRILQLTEKSINNLSQYRVGETLNFVIN